MSSKVSPTRHPKPLKRGKACMNCRFLKIKCDGLKPICGPCQLHPRDDECEYADGPGRSRTKVLEDTVTRLEARLLELENPEGSTPSVTLHDPYQSYKAHRLSKSPPLHLPDSPLVFSPLSPFSPTSTASSLPSGSSGSSTSPNQPGPIPTSSVGFEEPPISSLQTSLDNFLPHAQQFGFFLHAPTFRASALLAFPLGHPSRPTPGLLNAVQLFGVHFSQPDSPTNQERPLLIRTLQHVATDLLGGHPNKIIHTLQAEVLLAYYFLRVGSLLEAKVHTGSAISLALGSGLHKIRSANVTSPSTIAIINDQPYALPPPINDLQEAERINGFWSVLMLHKFITVALEAPPHVCGALEAPGMQIDTPWPIDMDNFQEGIFPQELQSNSTVRAFLNGYLGDVGEGASHFEMAAKAAILFHRAAHLTGQWSPTLAPRDRSAYEAAARSVNVLIDAFRNKLGPMPRFNTRDPSIRTTLLTHALIDAASIKLHCIFAYAYSSSKQICLSAARNMVNYGDLNLQELGHMNPIIGNLWMSANLIFVDEISRVRQVKETYPEAAAIEDELMESYRHGLNAMSLFSHEGKLMPECYAYSYLPEHQLSKVQDSFAAI
ncbi:hypothetical protein NLJ89_g4635 [Agrocybe chaxingu]|uniref:Zn(2)-C6 fungal-type domain-containing protein n=1 Tax=Agrocybe chaxingu TaxID=84603 RepID=A0A9W8K2E4_9AGAR|nr:hypothetical protein NLJ89_g4635 [Agrocybe chaxingu]